MSDGVKKRSYASPARRGQAEATRARVLEAAGELFLANGYARTSTAAVARAAGVSEASVFAIFGSKADLLVAVVADQVGRHADFPLRQNRRLIALAKEKDTRLVLREFATLVRRAHERSWRLLTVVGAAAQDDPNVAAAAAAAGQRRHDDCTWFITDVVGVAPAKAAPAADAVWVLISVENYRHLVIERNWPPQNYERWLTDLLAALLA